MRLGRMQDMAEQIVYVEAAEEAIAALRERGIGGTAARTLVQGHSTARHSARASTASTPSRRPSRPR
jgi:hypothetical protein